MKQCFMHDRSNPYNKENKAHGLWFKRWPNGLYEYKGLYVNDKMHGFWEWYHENGRLCASGTLNMGRRIGLWVHDNRETKKHQTTLYAQ